VSRPAIEWARKHCAAFSVSGDNINVDMLALERELSKLDKLQKDYAQQCEINDHHARAVLSQGDEIERLESRLDECRKLLDAMRQWHAVVAYSDFDKHEALWESYIVRAEAIFTPAVEKQK
jgi:hypothetical protein